ncbi:MAG: DNA recombination protein RmuC [Candidatus Izemoplasmatales bacterium]|jgi:DNA recombination protein RmuC|nr:DNA recombination protein RmuC [Candidatus Izemoplasmatales bacterium]MDD4595647.1 DNA recombination protein RmuC [Candidatus Izemoplasmatales bacterium]
MDPDLMFVIIIILIVLVLTGILYIIFSKKASLGNGGEEIKRLNAEISNQLGNMKTTVSQSIFDAIMKFNDQVNQKLSDNNQKSAENITDFRIAVNSELGAFKEKITLRLNESFQGLNETIDKRMGLINEKVEDRLSKGFTETNQTFLQIAERVKVIDDAQKNIQELSNEMIGLQQILKNNQSRGSFGEYQLNQLLYSVFGDNKKLYDIQYTIKEARGKSESVRADAVIFMPEPNGMIAIDSKFPFSAYSKLFDNKDLAKEEEIKLIQTFGADVKKHINEIASKYIISGITADYALMFVASDGILALLHSRLQNIVEHARSKNVTIVSPTTLIPLLSSYRAVSIDYERSKYTAEINRELMQLNKEFEKFNNDWLRLNENIQKLTKQSSDVNTRVEKITTKFGRIKNVDLLDDDQQMEGNNIEETENSSE